MPAGQKDEPTKPGWTEQEKARGTPQGESAGAAGEAEPKGRPTDDRAATEQAAAKTEQDSKPHPGRPQ
ncbi:hypothetical protein [Siccirubricoccus sp. G192]|uniref:hypothetical protein n=1 Tax=Siccirubricoccus sp. G192 TaxID=2849651 RepID=UPI001C2C3F61|nr:hypothetical protein [Siccirubricoccus sp. G192]MBV1797473.1 hypothetical protein [Siccirubricoccus sp. G192]